MKVQKEHHGDTHWREDGTCSYCGSINTDQLFKAIEDGVEIGPTDKSYKIYLNGKDAPIVSGACKFYFQHLLGAENGKVCRTI